METLCRVCGSLGNYDIFGKIPRFLNTDRRDLWQQPICKMVTDVTGIAVSTGCSNEEMVPQDVDLCKIRLQISKNDGLPERVCGLCISYLKHAVCFRNRAVQTRLSLLSAAFVTTKNPLEDFGVIPDHCVKSASDVPEKTVPILDEQSKAEQRPLGKHERFFDYEEKAFVEDDMTRFDGMDGIEVNHPEVFRERKCGFCLKRFMLEDTYDYHLDECLFRRLLEFIKDSNYIVRLKEEVAISNHEFIRRMVFAIQRVHKAIRGMQLPASAVGQLEELPLPLPPKLGSVTLPPKVQHFFQKAMTPPQALVPPPHTRSPWLTPTHPVQRPLVSTAAAVPKRVTACHNSLKSDGSSSISSGPQTPSPSDRGSGVRRVVCKFCDKNFLTISHLDGHMIKEHTH